MLARILYITDLHKPYQDPTTIKGQVQVHTKIQQEIIDFNKKYGVTHNIVGGDWYDRGFHGLGPAYGAMEMDRRLSASVNGNVFLCIGNHFYLERDENPEMYIIQPNQYIKPQIDIPMPEKPLFQVVPRLKIGNVQIDFFHYNKVNKKYYCNREDGCTYHIGVYHDDYVLPAWVRELDGYGGNSTQEFLAQVYNNIDLALHGHIHSKVGMVPLELNTGRKVPLIIPGSLGITQNKECFKHTDVQLPLIEIDDDSTVRVKLATFRTHIDELSFSESKSKKKKNKLLDEGVVDSKEFKITESRAELQSLPNFMTRKGYTKVHMNLISAALSETLNVATAVRILVEGDNSDEQC